MIGLLGSSPPLVCAPGSNGFSSLCTSSSSTPITSSSPGLQLASFVGFVLEALAVIVVLGVVGVLIIMIVANRADPDPTGRRPQSVYFFAIAFVTITLTILGSAVVVGQLIQLIGHHGPVANQLARTELLGGLITVASFVVFDNHLRRGTLLATADDAPHNPSRRVAQSYVSAVSFIAMLSLLATTILSVYMVFAIAGPGVFGSFGGRTAALRILLEALYLGIIAVIVLRTHRTLVSPELELIGYSESTPAPAPANSIGGG